MQKEVIELFANYNKLTNEAMNDVIKTLSKAEWEKSLGGYFPSVRSLCSHLYTTDCNWMKRFRNLRSFTTLKDAFFDKTYARGEMIFEDMGEYLARRPDLDNRILAFVHELTNADMDSVLKFTDPAGKAQERNAGGHILQYFNHGTHHRGAISVYLEQLGHPNDFASFGKVVK